MSYLDFEKILSGKLHVIRNQKGELIGHIKKERTGRFMHYCLVISTKLMLSMISNQQYLIFSPGCQDEIREYCRKLNGRKKK